MSTKNRTTLTLAATIATTLAISSGSALAYDAGDMIIRGGAVSVMPNEDSDGLSLNGADAFAGSDIELDDNTQLGISFTYMLSPQFGVEVLGATPFTHEITAVLGDDLAGALGVDLEKVEAGETKHLPPTISAQYYPLGAGSKFQPYLGAGLNITVFFDEEVSSTLDGALDGAGLGANAKLDLDESVGLSLQAGFDYAINQNWGVNGAIWYMDISTDATIKNDAGNKITSTVDIDPTVVMLGASYRF